MSVRSRAGIAFLALIGLPFAHAAAGPGSSGERDTAVRNSVTVDAVTAPGTDKARLAYGRHLASECVACHRPDAGAGAIPLIAGKPADEIIEALAAFRAERKTNPVMVSVAKSRRLRAARAGPLSSPPLTHTIQERHPINPGDRI